MKRALLLALALLLPGCFGGDEDARAGLVPYPRVGDVAVYEATGALVDFARWENGIPFAAALAQVRLSISPSTDALDGARAHHPAFKVTTEVAEAGVFDLRSERFVSTSHQAVVQSYHPLSQDQSIVAFDERGYPWAFGASALVGEELADGATFALDIPDNLGRGKQFSASWRVTGREDGAWVLTLEGLPAMAGTLWMEPGSAWPARVRLAIQDDSLAPHIRSDGGYPATMEARRVSIAQGAEPLPPRDRGATFASDNSVVRTAWDGEKPPDGEAGAIAYPLGEAVAEAKLLDQPLQDWLAAASDPILYRATFQVEPGPLDGSTSAHWLLQWVDAGGSYYEVQIARLLAPPLPVGVPRIEKSAPAEPPSDLNHGWFARESVPELLVPLSEGIRIVRDVFGATEVQIFLRSFTDPPGYSYFLDGGIVEGEAGRYTVVYNPGTAFIEQATGPVTSRLA